jgi:tetratricopeptide (TPR) repeat protein
LEKAIKDYNAAMELDSKDGTLYFNRGNTYAKKKDYDRAIADYNKAMELMSNYTAAYSQRKLAYKNRLEQKKKDQD